MENRGGCSVIKSAPPQAHMPELEAVDAILAFAAYDAKNDWAICRDTNPAEMVVRNVKDGSILELLEKEGTLKPSKLASRLAIHRSTATRSIGNPHQKALARRLGALNSPHCIRLERRQGS